MAVEAAAATVALDYLAVLLLSISISIAVAGCVFMFVWGLFPCINISTFIFDFHFHVGMCMLRMHTSHHTNTASDSHVPVFPTKKKRKAGGWVFEVESTSVSGFFPSDGPCFAPWGYVDFRLQCTYGAYAHIHQGSRYLAPSRSEMPLETIVG